MTEISPKAIQFIIAQEDGSEAYYDRTESHFDWPGGSSGPTVGVGYDLGYVTHSECMNDWKSIVSPNTIHVMLGGVSMIGEIAHEWVREHRTEVTITWKQAIQEFTDVELPKWEQRVSDALPNYDLLSPDSKGALVSLSYNRGVGGYRSDLPRFREMNAIRNAMAGKKFAFIPGLIKSMVRIWPNVQDLRQRRVLEANLFAGGLDDTGVATA